MPVSSSSKRKLDEVEVEETSIDQRKSILDISMTKLRCYNPRRKVEPSLRRSVLIFNTLKSIESQLKLEGVCVSPVCGKPEFVPAIQPQSSEDVIDDIPGSNGAAQNLLQSQLLVSPPTPPTPHSQQYEKMDYSSSYNSASYNTSLCNNIDHSNLYSSSSNLHSNTAQLGAGPYLTNINKSDLVDPSVCRSDNNSITAGSPEHEQCRATDPYSSTSHDTNISSSGLTSVASFPSAAPTNVIQSKCNNTLATASSDFANASGGNSSNDFHRYTCNNNNNHDSNNLHSSDNTSIGSKACWDESPALSTGNAAAATAATPSFTETLLSDTSKFILDSLLSSDKLVTVASFSSLFEFDGVSSHQNETAACCANYSQNSSANQNNNCSANSGCPIPPFSSLGCGFNNQTCTLPQGSITSSVCYNGTTVSSGTTTHLESWSPRNVSQHYQNSENTFSPSNHWNGGGGTAFYGNSNSMGLTTQQQSNLQHSHSSTSTTTTCRQESESPAMLGDIDCNTFDFDLFLPSLSPSMKLTQLNHDDLVHTLPSSEVSFSSSPCVPTSTLSPKHELLGDDLDHIMQILVGI